MKRLRNDAPRGGDNYFDITNNFAGDDVFSASASHGGLATNSLFQSSLIDEDLSASLRTPPSSPERQHVRDPKFIGSPSKVSTFDRVKDLNHKVKSAFRSLTNSSMSDVDTVLIFLVPC